MIALENNPVSLPPHDQGWRKINPELRLDTVIQYLWLWHSSQALPAEEGMKCSSWGVPWVQSDVQTEWDPFASMEPALSASPALAQGFRARP